MEAAVLKENEVDEQVEKALALFAETVDLSADLEIIGTSFPKGENDEPDTTKGEVFVIRDHNKPEGIEGAYVEVSIDEVISKVISIDKAQEFVSVIQNDRKPVVLHGVTRIVGYYSKLTSWNRSKIGEIRDRAAGTYGVDSSSQRHQKDRLETINAMGGL